MASTFPAKFTPYTDVLRAKGYHVGYTGKPWGPGNWQDGGRTTDPTGDEYNQKTLTPPSKFISNIDYAENFRAFLARRPAGAPFHFWFGCNEPHRDYDPDSGVRSGKRTSDVKVPAYFPDDDIVRRDLLDYKFEIDWFDRQLARIVEVLRETGELENTLIIVTSDNGMPFDRAKASLYEGGTRVPLAIRWGGRIPGGRVVNDLVSLIDVAPTILEASGLDQIPGITGKSLLPLLTSDRSGTVESDRSFVLLGKERHNYARPDNLGYPMRAIRTRDYLYIKNFKPERWPIGDPPYYWDHTKMTNPTKDFVLRDPTAPKMAYFYDLIYQKRAGEELYDMKNDGECIHNLATDARLASVRQELADKLERMLREQKDPRVLGHGDIFDGYPYYQKLPEKGFPGFFEYGKYNPRYMKADEAKTGR
jgi:N-sulfoglucosamine sulfohydrolase